MGNLTLNGSTSGQVTLTPPAVAGTNTITLPAATGTVLTTAGGQTISGTVTLSTLTSPAATALTIQSAGTTAMTIDTSQNVGIGTTSPSTFGKFAVTGAVATTSIDSNGVRLQFSRAATSYIEATNASGSLSFGTGGVDTNRMFIDSSGNVGVGTTSPAYPLDISKNQSGAITSLRIANGNLGANSDSSLLMYTANGTWEIRAGRTTGSLQFFTTAPSEAMRIDSSGNLLVGKTAASTTTGTGFEARGTGLVGVVAPSTLSDTYNYYNSTAGAYRFYVNNAGTINATSTTISAISDQRMKENIRDLDDGLGAIMALKPRKFDWKEGKGANVKDARGFIAQEFEKVFPDLIDEWKDPAPEGEEPYKAVRADLIPVLVKAIQELKAELDALKGTK